MVKRETRVTDGATLRKSRLMGMYRFIEDSDGASTKTIQSFMLMNYGLKLRRQRIIFMNQVLRVL